MSTMVTRHDLATQKSGHSEEEIRAAIAAGTCWVLDSGTSGNDDILIGSLDEVISDIAAWAETDGLPQGWTLDIADSIEE